MWVAIDINTSNTVHIKFQTQWQVRRVIGTRMILIAQYFSLFLLHHLLILHCVLILWLACCPSWLFLKVVDADDPPTAVSHVLPLEHPTWRQFMLSEIPDKTFKLCPKAIENGSTAILVMAIIALNCSLRYLLTLASLLCFHWNFFELLPLIYSSI